MQEIGQTENTLRARSGTAKGVKLKHSGLVERDVGE